MDYEKAYKDLMRDIDIAIKGQTEGETKVVLQNIKERNMESEDERIRKVFLSFIDNYLFWESDGLSKEKALAWLEKQKEQKPELCDMGRWDEESYNNGIHHVLQNPEAYGLTKQKPAEWSEEDNRYLISAINIVADDFGEDYGTVRWLKALPGRVNPQPKQEWSEEDEKMLKCCLIAINHYEKTCNIGDYRPTKFTIDGDLVYVGEVKSWLESRRPQPKQ